MTENFYSQLYNNFEPFEIFYNGSFQKVKPSIKKITPKEEEFDEYVFYDNKLILKEEVLK